MKPQSRIDRLEVAIGALEGDRALDAAQRERHQQPTADIAPAWIEQLAGLPAAPPLSPRSALMSQAPAVTMMRS